MEKRTFIVNGEEREAVWVDKQGDWAAHWEIDGVQYDGHYVNWGFSYTPETYLKESELSGDEWRKGGYIRYFMNGEQVYEQFCRESHTAALRIGETLIQLQENVMWEKLVEGTKIYYRGFPAKIGHIMKDQGAMMVHPDGIDRFPDPVWAKEDWEMYEDPTSVKIDYLKSEIWWWRTETPNT